MKTKAPNARFWIYWNGWVKITLRPGEEIHLAQGGRTDEGFSRGYASYIHDGDCVRSELSTDSRDCDGPLSTESNWLCPLENLNKAWREEDAVWRDEEGYSAPPSKPEWIKESAWQRDVYAEMAGY